MSFFNPSDFYTDIALGNLPGYELRNVIGRNSAFQSSTLPEDIWNVGGLVVWQTVASVLNIISDNPDDDTDTILLIEGLDANFVPQTEPIALNGTIQVQTANSYIRVDRATLVQQGGAYHGSNLGTINGTYSSASDPAFRIDPGLGQSSNGFITIPADTIGLISHIALHSNNMKEDPIDAVVRLSGAADDVTAPYTGARRTIIPFDGISGATDFVSAAPLPLGQKSDLWVTIITSGTQSTSATIDMTVTLVDIDRTGYVAVTGSRIGVV